MANDDQDGTVSTPSPPAPASLPKSRLVNPGICVSLCRRCCRTGVALWLACTHSRMLGAVGNAMPPLRALALTARALGGSMDRGGAVLYKKAETERLKVRSGKLNRRQFTVGVAAGIAAGALPAALAAQDAPQGWEQAVKKVLG